MTGFRFVVPAALAVVIGGCSWMQVPTASEKFNMDWQVQEPTRTTADGELFLSDGGFWGYKPEDRQNFEPQFVPGDLTILETDEDSPDHVFAVVQTDNWGHRLQRLDDHHLQDELTGDLRLLQIEDITAHDGLCLVSNAEAFDDDCNLSARHRRWHLYEVDTDGSTLQALGNFKDLTASVGFPVSRRALAGGDLLSHWVETDQSGSTAGPLLAIEAASRARSTLAATIAYDDSCDTVLEDSSLTSTVGYEPQQAGVASPIGSHPIAVEDAALRLGADAIVECAGHNRKLFTPMLSRPLLRDDEDRLIAPPSVGLIPRRLDKTSSSAAGAWSRSAALIAVGDPVAASYWVERAVTERPDGDAVEKLALSMMPVLVSAGQPEFAMRLGSAMTSRAWNPENVPDYLDGLIALLGHFDELGEQREHIERRHKLTERHSDPHRGGWYRWAQVRINTAQSRGTYGPAYREQIADFEDDDLEGWALALWATLQMAKLELPVVDAPQELLPRFTEYGVGFLWTTLLADSTISDCVDDIDDPCRLTSYGWYGHHRSSRTPTAHSLYTRAPIGIRHGFSASILASRAETLESPLEQAAFWLAAAPMTPAQDLAAVTETIMGALGDQIDRSLESVCHDLPIWQARFYNAAARGDSNIAGRSQRQWINFISWWADDGLDALCGGAPAMVEALERRAQESNPWTKTLLPLLETRLLEQTVTTFDASLFHRAASLAREVGDDEICTRWSLGMAIGAARSGHFDAAESYLVNASNCLSDDSPLEGTRNLVAGYLDFERGAGRSLVTDGGIDRLIAEATRRRIDDRDRCVGLVPLGFELDDHLPAPIVRIAGRIQLDPAPHDDFALQTASAVIDEGRAAYRAGIRDLHRGHLEAAAGSLDRARRDFRRIEHLPGLARVAFLDRVVFDHQLQAIADGQSADQLAPSSELVAMLRSGQAYLIIDRASPSIVSVYDQDPEALVAAFLIAGRDRDVEARFGADFALPTALCDADEVLYGQHNEAPVDRSIDPSQDR